MDRRLTEVLVSGAVRDRDRGAVVEDRVAKTEHRSPGQKHRGHPEDEPEDREAGCPANVRRPPGAAQPIAPLQKRRGHRSGGYFEMVSAGLAATTMGSRLQAIDRCSYFFKDRDGAA